MSRLIVPTPDGSSVLVGDPEVFSLVLKLAYILDELSPCRGDLLLAELGAILDAELRLEAGHPLSGKPPC